MGRFSRDGYDTRLASVRRGDHIYVLDQGRITEHGCHDELIARKALYADLFGLQASAYTSEPSSGPSLGDEARI